MSDVSRRASTGSFRHAIAVRGDDCYETPECATRALLAAEPIAGPIWEPACGPGAMVRVLRSAGHMVYATDLVDYGCEESEAGIDFLHVSGPSFAVGAIVTNPPYKLAGEFVAHALLLGIPKIVMLLRLQFLESRRRSAILDCGLLARVYPFADRLPMMHRHGWTGPRAGSAMALAWFVWELGYRGRAELRRLVANDKAKRTTEARSVMAGQS